MDSIVFMLGTRPVTVLEAASAIAGALLLGLLWLIVAQGRARRERWREARAAELRQNALLAEVAEIARAGRDLSGRVDGMAGQLNARQTDISRLMAERLDSVTARVGEELQTSAQHTGATLAQLKERLAVIDAAQTRIAGMTQEVVSLKDILANKQTRGAFGQGRMEAIVRDGLTPEFSVTWKS
jgi:DNA recombination protein RmuC